jgi:DNA gyrase/topoisomerase IV subunit B
MKFGNTQKDNFYLEIKHNTEDDFSQCLIINGIYARDGGNPIDYVLNKIIPGIRDKLKRKYPNIKPGDIKNKIKIFLIMRFFPNVEFTSQEKIKVANSFEEIGKFFKNVDWDKVVKQILRDKDLIDSITEYFSLKEKAKENLKLKKLAKKEKKIKSDKFYPAIKENKYLFIAEGESANTAIQPILGRETNAFYELKGVPLNAWEVSAQKFSANKELSELYKILNNIEFEKIIITSDKDADGNHIAGLLIGFFVKYLPQYLDRIYIFNTPIMATFKNGKIDKWFYEIRNDIKGKYFKGYGSWKKEWLKEVIKTDGLDKMLEKVDIDNQEILNNWLSSKTSDKRKEYIKEYSLDINKI